MVEYSTSVAPTPIVTSVSQFRGRCRVTEYLSRRRRRMKGVGER